MSIAAWKTVPFGTWEWFIVNIGHVTATTMTILLTRMASDFFTVFKEQQLANTFVVMIEPLPIDGTT